MPRFRIRRFRLRPLRRRMRRPRYKSRFHKKRFGSKRFAGAKGTRRIPKDFLKCTVKCSTDNIPYRELILGQGSTDDTLTQLSSNFTYVLNMTQMLERAVLAANVRQSTSAGESALPPRIKAYVHNLKVKLTIWNQPTAAVPDSFWVNGRFIEYYLHQNIGTSAIDHAGNSRSQWVTIDPITGANTDPGLSAFWDGSQANHLTAGHIDGDWYYLTQAPINKQIVKFARVKKFRIRASLAAVPPGGSAATANNINERTYTFDWKLERMVVVSTNITTFDHANASLIPGALETVSTVLLDTTGGQVQAAGLSAGGTASNAPRTYNRYLMVQVDRLDAPNVGGGGTYGGSALAQMRSEILCNLRPLSA